MKTFSLPLLLLIFSGAGTLRAEETSELKGVVILSRHGVRSTLNGPASLQRLVARPWPAWSVKEGLLTRHGYDVMKLYGAYYGEYLRHEGLLAGTPAEDAQHAYFRSNVISRTKFTAQAIGEGIFPGEKIVVEDYVTRGGKDPAFEPEAFKPFKIDEAAAMKEAETACSPAVRESLRPEFLRLAERLAPPGEKPSAELLARWTAPIGVKADSGLPAFTGPLLPAYSVIDNFTLQYTEGMPLADVGWGRIGPEELAGLSKIHAAYFALSYGQRYAGKVQCSSMGDGIVGTLERMKSGAAVPGAFGKAGDKLVVIGAHDSTIAGLGGLFGFRWTAPDGLAPGFILPGSALVFELRREKTTGRWFVRTRFTCQTLAQIREARPITLSSPPFSCPITIAGCPTTGAQADQSWEDFDGRARALIDPAFVVRASEVPAFKPAPKAAEPAGATR